MELIGSCQVQPSVTNNWSEKRFVLKKAEYCTHMHVNHLRTNVKSLSKKKQLFKKGTYGQ